MREIKFRSWVDGPKPFMLSDTVDLSQAGPYWVRWFGKQDVILLQYTGLKDKNGVEIYEGDMLSCTHETSEFVTRVEFDRGMFCYDPGEGLGANHALILLMDYQPEVIGNIYENPELLKESK